MNNGIRFCGSKWKSSMYYQPAKYVRIEYKNQISLFDLQYENLEWISIVFKDIYIWHMQLKMKYTYAIKKSSNTLWENW